MMYKTEISTKGEHDANASVMLLAQLHCKTNGSRNAQTML